MWSSCIQRGHQGTHTPGGGQRMVNLRAYEEPDLP
jgi:hypothetical protein